MIDKERMLLHCCCGPCASYVLEHLTPVYDISILFYNPNAEPLAEYEKRRSNLVKLLENAPFASDVKLLECDYDNAAFVDAVLSLRNQPEGGARCRVCFDLRLRKTAQRAKEDGYDVFATTMTVSPQKSAKALNEVGSQLSDELGIPYLVSDFKKQNGYLRSVELSNQYELYRQEYCGCEE